MLLLLLLGPTIMHLAHVLQQPMARCQPHLPVPTQLRALPFDQTEFEDLRSWFFNSRRPAAKDNRIAEWPRLHQVVVQMIDAKESAAAFSHLRCLAAYLHKTHHPSLPRILRAAVDGVPGAAACADVGEA
eukprot:SAG31_NODE_28723_length_406_cov_0.543974_1_plen_129_part_10